MPSNNSSLAARTVQTALLILAVGYIALYIWIALHRLGYPFELEWIEGAMVDSVQRVLDGKPLFVRPSPDYGYFMYPPLYFWISAAVAKWTGVGFFPLRLVSFMASLGCMALMYALIYQENRSHFAGLMAAGLFAATFRLSGAWLDIARIDSLFLFFTLASLYCLRWSGPTWPWQILTGSVLCLAVLTKQAAVVVLAPPILGGLWLEPRKTAPAALIAAGLTLAAYGYGNLVSHGWVHYYLFELPRHHPLLPNICLEFWTLDLLRPLPVALGLAVGFIAFIWWKKKTTYFFYGFAGLGMIGAAYLFRLHFGGYNNVLFPVYAWIAIVSGLAVDAINRRQQTSPWQAWKTSASLVISGLFVLQLGMLIYDPSRQIPAPGDRQAGLAFIEKMRSFPGEIYVPFTGYLPTLAGKRSLLHQGTLADILIKGKSDQTSKQLSEAIRQAIREQRFSAIITINGDVENGQSRFLGLFGEETRDYYRLQERLQWGDRFMPVTGAPRRPEYIWVPVPAKARPE